MPVSSLPHHPTDHQDQLLDRHLRELLGPMDPEALQALQSAFQWVEIAAGETLITQGEPGDCMYLAISGRLRACLRGEDGQDRPVREMARGQVIGEMALYTDEPRSATVVAIRDSVLVRLDKAAFLGLLAQNAQLSVALTRQIIRRLQSAQQGPEATRPVTMALLPVTAGVDAAALAAALAAQLRVAVPQAPVRVLDAAALDEELQQPGLARSDAGDVQANRRIALALDEIEATHGFVLLVADDGPTAWTERCSRRCDELLLLADATQPPALHPSETQFLSGREGRPGLAQVAEVLVLLHPEGTANPQNTRTWLDRRPVADHVHMRPARAADMARLARLQSRTAVGLVFAGGGARGLAHLGIVAELEARGMHVDCVGGTSIGAIMAAVTASAQPLEQRVSVARTAFMQSPTGDFNPVPLLSLIRGQRLRRVVDEALTALFGGPVHAEDLWKNFYAVASNYSRASEVVLRRGPLQQALLASAAIPGALPPVLRDGELLCDGGTFNNFPVDVMRRQRGIGRVIGVDLGARAPRRIPHAEVPSAWALFFDRLRPRRLRRYRFPSLVSYLMNVTILYSGSRQRQAQALTDLYFNPPLHRVGMLQWKRFDAIVRQGRDHAAKELDAMSDEALAPYRL
jgi:NTE family protein